MHTLANAIIIFMITKKNYYAAVAHTHNNNRHHLTAYFLMYVDETECQTEQSASTKMVNDFLWTYKILS